MKTIGMGVMLLLAWNAIAQDTCQAWSRRKCSPIVEPAKLIERAAPKYPRMAKDFRQEGVVRVLVHLNAQGQVVDAEVIDGPVVFRSAALEAAERSRFRSARVNHRSVASKTVVTVTFVVAGL